MERPKEDGLQRVRDTSSGDGLSREEFLPRNYGIQSTIGDGAMNLKTRDDLGGSVVNGAIVNINFVNTRENEK